MTFMQRPSDVMRWLDDTWRGGGTMPMDAFALDDTYVLRFDLPGVDPDEVDVTLEAGLLTVTATRRAEDTEGATWLVRERPHGRHSRQVRLGERLDVAGLEANYDRGVLTISIPVKAEAKPRRIDIGRGEAQGSKVLEAKSVDSQSDG